MDRKVVKLDGKPRRNGRTDAADNAGHKGRARCHVITLVSS